MKVYAGIGSRRAPGEILSLCERVARMLRAEGWSLSSGHAIGCDQAFERGAAEDAQVFLPWRDYESDVPILANERLPVPTYKALETVIEFHPAPGRLSMAAIRLHGRNAHIVLGRNLRAPVDQVVCWTPDPDRGGTSQALRIAKANDIPVFNLADSALAAEFKRRCAEYELGADRP